MFLKVIVMTFLSYQSTSIAYLCPVSLQRFSTHHRPFTDSGLNKILNLLTHEKDFFGINGSLPVEFFPDVISDVPPVLYFISQLPRVLDDYADGIDLYFWGQVFTGVSEKVQVVSPSCVQSSPLSEKNASLFLAFRKLASSV